MTPTTRTTAPGTGRRRPRQGPLARTALTAIAAVATTAGLTACGDDDSDATDADAATTTSAPTTDEIEILAIDYAFEDIPDRVDAGTTLSLRNESTAEVHELTAFRLPDGEERPLDDLLQLPEEQLDIMLAGPPDLVVVAPPGGEAFVPIGDGTLSEPGRYLLLCAIPTGADPDEYMSAAERSEGPPDVAGGPPHLVHGMTAELHVD